MREKGTAWIDDEYLEYSYNNLALSFDLLYGLDEHQSRLEKDKTYKYMENGAYALLAPYKEKLLSMDPDISNNALIELFANELDDGGHDKYVSSNIFGTKSFVRADVSGKESKHTLTSINTIAEERKKASLDVTSVLGEKKDEKGNTLTPNGYYQEEDNIAYIQFDEFSMGQEIYDASQINETNYWKDSITLFHYANEKIQNNPDIKDVVIDLSANGGGTMLVSEYIASWVCGCNHGTIRETKTGSTMEYCVKADVNLDGYYDSQDYLASDINVYVIISNGSFSCGNKLPCNIKDNRPLNTFFIGSRTGGGSCAIRYLPLNFLGGIIRISSTFQLGRSNATKDNFISNESGVEADFYSFEDSDYAKFVDKATIKNKIINNRNHN